MTILCCKRVNQFPLSPHNLTTNNPRALKTESCWLGNSFNSIYGGKTFLACVFVITVRLRKFLVALKLSINVLKVPSSQLQASVFWKFSFRVKRKLVILNVLSSCIRNSGPNDPTSWLQQLKEKTFGLLWFVEIPWRCGSSSLLQEISLEWILPLILKKHTSFYMNTSSVCAKCKHCILILRLCYWNVFKVRFWKQTSRQPTFWQVNKLLHPNKTKTVQTVVVFNKNTVSKLLLNNISTLNAKTVWDNWNEFRYWNINCIVSALS